MVCDQYMVLWKTHNAKEESRTENNAKMYDLVLSQCPPELETILTSSFKSDAVQLAQDYIALLLLICDIIHNYKENKQGTVVVVESCIKFTTVFQTADQTIEVCSKLFQARVDTVNTHKE